MVHHHLNNRRISRMMIMIKERLNFLKENRKYDIIILEILGEVYEKENL